MSPRGRFASGAMYAPFMWMQRTVTDRYLPPDRDAFVAAEPPTGRIIVIAPTRAACETIELALGLRIPTLLEKQPGQEIRELAAAGKGFGVGAGTGTCRTVSIAPMGDPNLGTESTQRLWRNADAQAW